MIALFPIFMAGLGIMCLTLLCILLFLRELDLAGEDIDEDRR